MTQSSKLICQLKEMPKVLLIICIPTFLVIGFVWLETKLTPMTAYFLTADTAEIGNQPPYAGIVSNLGILIWSFSLASCWIAAAVIKKDTTKRTSWQSFFFFSGLVTALLLFDDMLQIHEQSHAYLQFLSQDAAELVVFSLYGALILYYIVTFRNLFKKTEYLILLLAVGFLGVSLVVDQNHETVQLAESNRSVLLEEGAKFLGIASWLTYFARTSLSKLRYNHEEND